MAKALGSSRAVGLGLGGSQAASNTGAPGEDLPARAVFPSSTEKFEDNSEGARRTQTVVLPVLGMTCAACQHHVQQALQGSSGVLAARVDLMRQRARVDFDSTITGPRELVEVVRRSGYEAVLPRSAEASAHNDASERTQERKAGWQAAATIGAGMVAMLAGMPLGMASGGAGWFDHELMRGLPWMYALSREGLAWGLLIITALLAVWAGGSIYASAWKALCHKETNMNTLVSLGTGIAFLYSTYVVVWRASGDVYFDSVLLILGFLLLGKWLEGRARHRALAAVDALAELQPAEARVRRAVADHFVEEMVPLERVRVGDVVVILPGERVPVDALIESGRTTVDESMLTGEAVPLERGVGERVLAGSLNYDGAVIGRVVSAGTDTTLAQIARLVEQAQGSRAPMERLADRASAIFVPVVLGLAVATFAGWLLTTHDVARAITATVAVLVIACPCAMGLAVPAALTVAIGRGAHFGVLIKGGEALERLAGLQVVVMDKTGTLTVGKPLLVGIHGLGAIDDSRLMEMAAAVEDHSAHPLAHAVVARAKEMGLSWAAAENVLVVPGRGLTGKIGKQAILLGNVELMKEWAVPFPATLATEPEAGVTRLWMAVDDSENSRYELVGYFDAKDTVRTSAKPAMSWLRTNGIAVEMLTGDSAGAAGPIAAMVGIEKVASGLLPADKVGRIRELQTGTGKTVGVRVGMVGDGINDAAALAQADAGIAMGGGAALAQEAGDVLLLSSDPAGVCTSIALARATVRVMRQNLGWAVGYNVVGIPLAAGLLSPFFHLMLTPWMAAAAMAFSSVSVLMNSLRLRGFPAPITD